MPSFSPLKTPKSELKRLTLAKIIPIIMMERYGEVTQSDYWNIWNYIKDNLDRFDDDNLYEKYYEKIQSKNKTISKYIVE